MARQRVHAAVQGLQEQQSQWTIPDTLLRSNMKDAIAEDFLPSYSASSHAYTTAHIDSMHDWQHVQQHAS